MDPVTLWESGDAVASGSRVLVRAASFTIASATRGCVTLTVRVAPESGRLLPDASITATVLLDPTEAVGLAQLLREAAARADQAGPGLYSEEVDALHE